MPLYNDKQDKTDDRKMNIYRSCLEGKVDELVRLVGEDANMVVKDGQRPLHIVATSGREDMVAVIDALLKTGSDVNAKTTTDEDTVLHLVIKHAVLRLAFQTCLMILEHNPDLDIRNRNLRTPYDLAMAQEYFELANVLDGSMTPEEAREYYIKSIGELYGGRLIEAVMNDNEEEAMDCVKQGADCNQVNKHGAGAIHYVFTDLYLHPPLDLLSKMVANGADVNLRDYEGDTALNLAIKKTSLRPDNTMYKVVDQLLQWGADPTHKDLDGNDALALAENRKYLDIVKLLKKQKTSLIVPPPHETPVPSPRYQKSTTPYESRSPITHSPSPVHPDWGTPVLPAIRSSDPLIAPDREESITSAIEDDNTDELDALLNDPHANLNVPNSMGLFPLHVAILRNNPVSRNDMVQQLLNKGADINVKAIPQATGKSILKGGNTPLHMSAARDQLDTVRILLTYDPAISPTNNEGLTPYNYAEQNGNSEMMRLLKEEQRNAERKENPNKPDNRDELQQLLQDPDANVNVQSQSGLFPLHLAIMENDPLIRETYVKRLISRGADVNAKALPRMQGKLLLREGNTPLHMAVIRKQLGIAKILLNSKARKNSENCDGKTPYFYAESNKDEKMMELLNDIRKEETAPIPTKPPKKPPLTARDPEPTKLQDRGRTGSLDEVSNIDERRKDQDGLDDLVKDPDANVNIRNANGLYPIHQAIMRNDPIARNQLIEKLIEKGADVNCRTLKSGNTPLHLAVTRGQLGTVKLLLGYRPIFSIPNLAGKTPYSIAEENNHMEILALLESYKRNVVDKRKNNAAIRDKANCTIS
ncbi:ankyrin-1-like isoform X6 [Crassostrea angulata]|uniref:ankyrin-1-like isoform X6 n=1 Tax=Magallana angulata TaxID=2784310 RepID=UPI0022B1EA2B|nr:ankyrin-1-like isoform X6 [Crassostrea angulata]